MLIEELELIGMYKHYRDDERYWHEESFHTIEYFWSPECAEREIWWEETEEQTCEKRTGIFKIRHFFSLHSVHFFLTLFF